MMNSYVIGRRRDKERVENFLKMLKIRMSRNEARIN